MSFCRHLSDVLDVDVIFTLKAKSISHKTHITARQNDVYLLLLTLHRIRGKIGRQFRSVWDIILSFPFVGMRFWYTGLRCWKQLAISKSRNRTRAIRVQMKHCEKSKVSPARSSLLKADWLHLTRCRWGRSIFTATLLKSTHYDMPPDEGLDSLIGKGGERTFKWAIMAKEFIFFPPHAPQRFPASPIIIHLVDTFPFC